MAGIVIALVVMSAAGPAVGQEGPSTAETDSGDGADTAETDGPVIADVEMTCDLHECENPLNIDKYLDIAGLYVGRPIDDRMLETARKRLKQTGLFESISFQTMERASGSISVHVEAVGATRVRKIEFTGVDPPPFRSELRKLLVYREGESYRDDLGRRNTQLSSLEKEFEKAGYFGTDVEMIKRPVGGDRKLVDLVFKIDKGKSLRICDVGIRGLEVMTHAEARRHLLSNVPFFARRLALVEPRYTTETLSVGQAALVRAYRKKGYFRARIVDEAVQKDFDAGCVRILIDLSEGPRWEVEFSGHTAFEPRELRDELPFVDSGYVDREEVVRAERAIRQLYETRGYPFARVEGREIREDRLHRRLLFEIEEGPRLEIADLTFHGNRALSDSELREGLGTQPFRVFESGGYLQTEQLLSDLGKIEKRYREKGYLRAVVEGYTLERVGDGELVVHIDVDEGPRTMASDVRFEGVRSLSNPRVHDEIDVHTDEPFVPVQVRADRSRIVQLYSSVGYPIASVETVCQRVTGEEVPCERPELPSGCLATSPEMLEGRCGWEDEAEQRYTCQRRRDNCPFDGGVGDSEEVRVQHRIREGPLVTTGELLIQGNYRTRDRVIHRELPLKSGDIFDVRKILKGQSNLRSLGIFDSVSIEAMGLDEVASESPEKEASVAVSVEESRNRFVEFKFGLEGRDLLDERRRLLTTGEVEYRDRNLFGSALELKPRVFGAADLIQLGRSGGGAISSDPGLGPVDYLIGSELAFENPRFLKGPFGVENLSLTVTPFYLVDLLGVTNDQLLREEWGLAMEARKEFSELLERFFVSFGVEGKQTATAPIDGPRRNDQRVFSPRRVTGKLIPKFTLDRRDSPLNPTEGYFLRLRPELVSGDALSENIDSIDDSYLRVTWKSDLFLPLWSNIVLAQSIRAGQVVPLFGRETRVPADERYYLGGAGSVRGYPNNSLGPRFNDQPSGGEFLLNYNLELRYPLIRGVDLRGAAFFDAGLLVDCFDDRNVTERQGCYGDAFGGNPFAHVRTAAGVGLRYIIADQIPLLFDYGIALNRRQNEGIGNLQFHLGYTF